MSASGLIIKRHKCIYTCTFTCICTWICTDHNSTDFLQTAYWEICYPCLGLLHCTFSLPLFNWCLEIYMASRSLIGYPVHASMGKDTVTKLNVPLREIGQACMHPKNLEAIAWCIVQMKSPPNDMLLTITVKVPHLVHVVDHNYGSVETKINKIYGNECAAWILWSSGPWK